ncbi:MAG TPA: SPOR domain-containing protein [Steroidobacteraceae bacterium]|nr:SPOR domain-containing protein [Steroidobacteraceae bacterium]
MPRSSTRRTHCLTRYCAALLVALVAAASATAQPLTSGPGRFIDIVEVNDHDDQVDIVVQFTCSLRYLTHQPASEGKELRVQLQPQGDCGVAPGSLIEGELPPVSGGARILEATRIESDVPGQVTLVFSFRNSERFVLAQGVDPHGLRLRLIDRARGRGKVMINEPSGPATSYAVNLESQPSEFPPETVQRARDRLKVPVFVSQAVVDEQTWYRLRAGPFEKQADAERVLNQALADYPRAWLAIGDEVTSSAGPAETLPAVERIGSDPALDPAALATLVADARAAMTARDYTKAIAALTKLQRQPEFPERAAMQELLGLARERSGQLAHAKAEYEEYLRRYPAGEAADRITRRLATLRAASLAARTGTGGGGAAATGWTVNGGFAQMYRNDGTTVSNTANGATGVVPNNSQTQQQNALYTDVDLLARRRGERFDVLTRVSAGYAYNFAGSSATSSSDSTKRVSVATIELDDRKWGLLGRFGRQSRNSDGVLGTFDGAFASWQIVPAWAINVTAGYPVEQTNLGIQRARSFWSVAIPYTPPGAHWDASVFFAQQKFEGETDRRGTGFEARLLLPKGSLTALVDYDIYFKSLNAAALLGTLQLPDRWNLSFDAEKRNAPVISLRNSLIGQPVTTLDEMRLVFTNDEIHQLAIDRTAVTSNYSLTATRPLGQRFQFSTTVSATEVGATPASGGVPAQDATGLDLSYQAQIYGSNLWRKGDFNVLSIAYANTEAAKLASIAATSRMPIGGSWRLGPRLTIDHRQLSSDGSTELSFVPSVLIDYQHGQRLLQFEAGGQIGKRDNSVQTQNTKRYYVSLAYRLGF